MTRSPARSRPSDGETALLEELSALVPDTATARRERICAFLDVSGRCSVYESRPFGCRTLFCARATLPARTAGSELRELVNRLRDIASRHEAGGDAPRPLSRVFAT